MPAVLAEADAAVGVLLAGLYARGLSDSISVVIVSDHGMAEVVNPGNNIRLSQYVNTATMNVIDTGALIGIWPDASTDVDRLLYTLDGVPHLHAYARDEVPAQFHYNNNRLIPPVVVLVDDGYYVRINAPPASLAPYTGSHGYDNTYESMNALLLISSPLFSHSALADQSISNVNLYSLLCHMLNIKPAQTDGSLEPFRPYLRSQQ